MPSASLYLRVTLLDIHLAEAEVGIGGVVGREHKNGCTLMFSLCSVFGMVAFRHTSCMFIKECAIAMEFVFHRGRSKVAF